MKDMARRRVKKIKKSRVLIVMGIVLALLAGTIFGVKMRMDTTSDTVLHTRKLLAPIDASTLVVPLSPDDLADYEAMLTTLQRQADYYTEVERWYGEDAAQFTVYLAEVQVALYETHNLEAAEQAINAAANLMDSYDIASGAGELTYRKGILLANKQICLPYDFQPGENPVATRAMQEMAAAAAHEGIHIEAFSTYRSAALQEDLFNRYVAADGEEEAARYSSRPGCSDHQTGRAFDIGGTEQWQWAETTFDGTPAAVWLEQNAANYGFIMRYPQGKEAETGYMYESWHYRYVGDIAPRIYASGQSLEAYLGLL